MSRSKKIVIGLTIILVLIFICYIFYRIFFHKETWGMDYFINIKNTKPNSGEIIVWTYWEGAKSPLVELCLDRINKSCELGSNKTTKYTHICLDNKKVLQYIPEISEYSCTNYEIQIKTDIVRLLLLKKYGGIWMDACCFILAPMNKLFRYHCYKNVLQGFSNSLNSILGKEYPVIENWVLKSPKNHPLISDWIDELRNIPKCDSHSRQKHVYTDELDKTVRYLSPDYHYTYFIMQKLIKNRGIRSYENIHLVDCFDTQVYAERIYMIADFLKLTIPEFIKRYKLKNCTVIKFVGKDRAYIDQKIDRCVPGCFLKSVPIDLKKYMDEHKSYLDNFKFS